MGIERRSGRDCWDFAQQAPLLGERERERELEEGERDTQGGNGTSGKVERSR